MTTGARLLAVVLLLSILSSPPASGGQQEQAKPQPAERQETYGRTPVDLVPYGRALEPYRRFFLTPLEYRGPSRGKPDAFGLATVRIGLLAPLEGTVDDALGASLLRGVQLALAEGNEGGGYGGLPFELVARNDEALWGSSSNTLVQFAYSDRVWAVIGSIDSNSTHVALRAALKAELPMVNVGSTDPTVTETSIPWIIRTTPDDRQTGYRLAQHLFVDRKVERVAVLRASDRYGRFGVKEFRDAARRLRRPLAMEVLFRPGSEDFASALDQLSGLEIDAIVLWAGAEDAGRIVRQARERGLQQPIFGTDRLVDPAFLLAAGPDAEGVEATAWMAPERQDQVWSEFSTRFRDRFGMEPDTWAAYAYDAAKITIDAIRKAGLNHARIMDALAALHEYRGVAGPMSFDNTWNNVASPLMVRVVDGRFVTLDDDAAEEIAALSPADGAPLRVGVLASEAPEGRDFLAGAETAAASINAAGGVGGRPLELVPMAPGGPWRTGASLIARMTAVDDLLALIGGSDGATAHVAAQIATRRQLPYISTSPEESLTRAGDHWVLRGVASDATQARLLLRSVAETARPTRAVLVVPPGREGRERLASLREACGELGVVIAAEVSGQIPSGPLPAVAADAVLLWLDAEPALEFLRTTRPNDGRWLLGSSRLAHRGFVQEVALLGHELRLPAFAPSGREAVSAANEGSLQQRLGFDLVRVVAEAARHAPGDAPVPGTAALHSEALRSGLIGAPAYAGRTGLLRFDSSGNRAGGMTISTLQRGGNGSPGEAS